MAVRWAFCCGSWSPTRGEWTKAAAIVQSEEKERIGKFVFQKDAKLAMAGRLLIRKALSDVFGLPYDEQRLRRTPKGRPYAEKSSGSRIASFNVSHSGNFAVLAAESSSSEIPVGVDVMRVDNPGGRRGEPIGNFFHTMRRQFTRNEWETIRTPPNDLDQLVLFYRHWCLKESYVKALGIGIGTSLQKIEFATNPNRPTRGEKDVYREASVNVDEIEERDWTFEESWLDYNHCVAVALQNSDTHRQPSQFIHLTIDDLLLDYSMPHSYSVDETYWECFKNKRT